MIENNPVMRTKTYETVKNSGYGMVKLGSHSHLANWNFYGLYPVFEWKTLNGTTHTRKSSVLEYGRYEIWFDESPSDSNSNIFPKISTTSSLMIDEKIIGEDKEWWVIGYSMLGDKFGVEISNRPSGYEESRFEITSL